MIRVFLVDDHEIVRRGMRDLIDATEDMVVVGEAATARDAIECIPETVFDVVLLDVCLPDGDGVDVWRAVRDLVPAARCVMLTALDDDVARLAAIRAGTHGFMLKDVRCTAVLDAVRHVASGRSLFTSASESQVVKRLEAPLEEDPRLACLSRQEHRILALLVQGLTNRQMAREMGLTEKTVKNYVSNLLLKLGMQCRTEAAVYAARNGFLTPPPSAHTDRLVDSVA